MLENLKAEVCWANRELPRRGLVAWTSGNVIARDPESGLVVAKPSGVLFEDLAPEKMLVVDLDGKIIEGDLRPSAFTTSITPATARRPAAGLSRFEISDLRLRMAD